MAWVKRIAMLSLGVAVSLVVINLVTRSFAPGVRGYLGLA